MSKFIAALFANALIRKSLLGATLTLGTFYGSYNWWQVRDRLHLTTSMKEMEKLFKRLDADGSGKLDEGELRRALLEVGLKLSDGAIHAMVEAADKNHDGAISLQEWLDLCAAVGVHVVDPVERAPWKSSPDYSDYKKFSLGKLQSSSPALAGVGPKEKERLS